MKARKHMPFLILTMPIEGKFKSTTGVVGSALKLDGYTTCITREALKAPKLTGNFTIEAWVAQAAYALYTKLGGNLVISPRLILRDWRYDR